VDDAFGNEVFMDDRKPQLSGGSNLRSQPQTDGGVVGLSGNKQGEHQQ